MFGLLVKKSQAYKEGTNSHSNQFMFTSSDRQLSIVTLVIEQSIPIFVQSNY